MSTSPPSTTPPDDELGDIWFEHWDANLGNIILGWSIFVIVGGFGFPLFLLGILAREFWVFGFGSIFLFTGLFAGYRAHHYRYAGFRCHEEGLCLMRWWGNYVLRYTDIETFTYNEIPRYFHGIQTGTEYAFRFDPFPDIAANSITYAIMSRREELWQIRLCDVVSHIIARRMGQEFTAKKPVVWTPYLTFLPEGLEYRPRGFLKRKEAIVLPYDTVDMFNIQDRKFHLWQQGDDRPVINEKTSQPNFFPGYIFWA